MGFLDSRITKPNSFITLQTSQDSLNDIEYNPTNSILWEKPENVYWMPLIVPNIKNFILGIPTTEWDIAKYASTRTSTFEFRGHIFPIDEYTIDDTGVKNLDNPNNYYYFRHIQPRTEENIDETKELKNNIFKEFKNMINIANYSIVIARSKLSYDKIPSTDYYNNSYYDLLKTSIPIISIPLTNKFPRHNYFLRDSVNGSIYLPQSTYSGYKKFLLTDIISDDVIISKDKDTNKSIPIDTLDYKKYYIPLQPNYIYFYYLSFEDQDNHKCYIPAYNNNIYTDRSNSLYRMDIYGRDYSNNNIVSLNNNSNYYIGGLKITNGAIQNTNWKCFYTNKAENIKITPQNFYNNYSINNFSVKRKTSTPNTWENNYYYNYDNSNQYGTNVRKNYDIIRIYDFTNTTNQCYLYLNIEIKNPIINILYSYTNNSHSFSASNNFVDLEGNKAPLFKYLEDLRTELKDPNGYCRYDPDNTN